MERLKHAIEELRARVRGNVFAPSEPDYALECSGFNTALAHTPDAVVVVSSVDDVSECGGRSRAATASAPTT